MRMAQESEASDEDYINMALIHYQAETGNTFKYRHYWEVLKDSPKWNTQELLKFATESERGSKRHKSSSSSSFNIEFGDASINLNTNVGDNDEDEVQEIPQTMGRDKARAAGKNKVSGSSSMNDEALPSSGVSSTPKDIRFYLLPYDHLTGEQRMSMDEARAAVKAKYNLQY
ncbi:hypothetical protein Tco_1370203 [Tanacetum coccineum]